MPSRSRIPASQPPLPGMPQTAPPETRPAAAAVNEWGALVDEILCRFTRGSDGEHARVGRVQVGQWRERAAALRLRDDAAAGRQP